MSIWIVTGASRGLGRALCQALVDRQQPVLACARDAAALQSLKERGAGLLRTCVLDLNQPEQSIAALERVVDPVEPIAGLINNAGIGCYKPFLAHSADEIAAILQVNLAAPMQLCHWLLPRLLRQGGGQIVNIGSDLGRRPLANMAPYVAAKHGLTGFSHSLLREYKAQGIKVSLINPGIIDTHFGGDTDVGQRDPAAHLQPDLLAQLIVQCLLQPGAMLVDELSVHPLGQADF